MNWDSLPVDVALASEEELHVAEGLRAAKDVSGGTYVENAFVPSEFRLPRSEELSCFCRQAPEKERGFVAVLPVGDEPTELLRRYHHGVRRGQSDEALGKEGLKALLHNIGSRVKISGNLETRPFQSSAARELTVTRASYHPNGARAGMHIDGMVEHRCGDLLSLPNRLSVNLGLCERWFLWIPYSLRVLAEHLRRPVSRTLSEGQAVLNAIAADVPILRVRVRPGWAYIAPTEAVFHDASTLTADRGGLSWTLLGGFSLKAV